MNAALFVLVGICCAVLLFRAAYHERMNPWTWAAASSAATGACALLDGGIGSVLLAQAAIFGMMWWYNMQRQKRTRG